ncbi:crossover junction endodeoxyribonuclease [Desulfonema ishimotonii]|uniref:Crossover junction endodeoxyribonuclease RuvC n=1 Tax=Desulfonema ishimotonii TaxID=45657 RepID=A0A401FWZ5_9BACT|nr:crossover junction endodeoxyribonuclease RuvC [Desulfonema ishimotonii]GBC61522.1 crossover junction endodeoxyribonuclease [Desulfonema ishimotonii]
MKIIGIDPGLAATGVGVVTGRGVQVTGFSFGAIYTPKTMPTPERLDHIYSKLLLVLQDETPDLMVVEDVFSLEKYPRSGITLGKVSGVILLAGCRNHVPVTEVAVREAKHVLTGNGNASKAQLERSVRHTLSMTEPIKPSHASDALALALIGLFRTPACCPIA